MRKRILLVIALAIAGDPLVLRGKGGGSTIKIGMLYNMTGAQASLDGPSANGAKLAAKELNAAGGVLGKKIELVAFDGKTDAATIGKSATQLVRLEQGRGDVRLQRQRHGDGRRADGRQGQASCS